VLVSTGELRKGREYLLRALELNKVLGNRRAQAADLASLGNACVLNGETTEALEYLDEAVQLAKETQDTDLQTRALIIRGDVHRDLGHLEAAHDDYATAVEELERVRVAIIEEEHQIGFFERDKAEVYERLILILLAKHRISPALDVVQQAKSRALIQILGRSHFAPSPNSDKHLIAREQELKTKMNALLSMARGLADETERLRRSAEIAGINNQLNILWGLLAESSEEYVDLRQGLPLKISEIQDLCVS